MNGYKAFWNGRETEIYADSLYSAKLKAIDHWRIPKSKRHMVSVILCERPDGSIVEHSTASL